MCKVWSFGGQDEGPVWAWKGEGAVRGLEGVAVMVRCDICKYPSE